MPARELMTFSAKEKRWQKFYQGKNYKRSVKQLAKDFPDLVKAHTKAGTREAANRWWESKLQEFEEQKAEIPSFEQLVAERQLTKEERVAFNEEFRTRMQKAIPVLKSAGVDVSNWDELGKHQKQIVDASINLALNNELPSPEIDKDRTILHQLDKWLNQRHGLAKLKEKQPEKNKKLPSLATYEQNKSHATTLRKWLDEEADADASIDQITSSWLADFRDYLIGKVAEDELQPKSALNILGTVAQFVDWLAIERELIARPSLMAKDGWKKLTYDPEAYPMTVETFQKTYDVADELTRLYLLLMANCGYTAKDLSDLKPAEIDWMKGRIKRRRSKGIGYENAPIVDRPLWSSTFRLLKQFGTKSGERVLFGENGERLVVGRKDLVGERVKAAIKKAGFESGKHYRPKDIRSGCATLIDASRKHDGWEDYFLGHSPQGVTDKHYVGKNADKQDQFDELTAWLETKWFSTT